MVLWSIVLALTAVVLTVIYYHNKFYSVFKEHGIPYVKSIPFIGTTWKLFFPKECFADSMQKMYNIHGDAKYIVQYEFTEPIFVVRDPELIKSITVKNFDHFVNHQTFLVGDSDPLFSKNLFILKDDVWKNVRNLVSPTFTTSKMKAMFPLLRDCAKRYGEILFKLPDDQRILELKDTFTRCTNDAIASCAFGITIDSMTDRENIFYVMGRKANNFDKFAMFKFLIARYLPFVYRLFRLKIIAVNVDKFFEKLIADNIKERKEKGINRPDMIQLLLDTREKSASRIKLTNMDIASQAFIFVLGGLENVSTQMCFAAYEIGVNEKVQRKLQDEIDDVLANCNGEVTYEALTNMKYLDGIVNEALRMYPIAMFTDRLCTKQFELPPTLPGSKPYVMQKGGYIQIPIYAIQRDPRYFKDPDKFIPDRFIGNAKKEIDAGAYVPFGMGPRMCIGNRFALLIIKILLFELFAKCNLKPCEKTTIPMQLTKEMAIMAPKDNFWFKIEPRSETCPVYVNSATSNTVH
ncbi:Cytochrome P450 9e2 [Anthophora quadrimaculata]